MGNESAPETNTDLGYGKLFAIVRRRRNWILGVFTGMIALTTPLAVREEPTYESSMQLLVEANYQANEHSDPGVSSTFVDSSVEIDYATQLTLMRSSELLQRAIDILDSDYPDLTLQDLRKALGVSQIEENEVATKLFQVTFVGDHPLKTKDVLEAIRTVYLNYNLEQQKARLASGLIFLDEQLPIARQELDKAQQALKNFRQTYNLIDPTQQAEAIARTLNDLHHTRQELQAELSSVQSQLISVNTALGTHFDIALASARLSQSSRYQSLLNDFQETEKELAIQGLTYTDQYPAIINLREQRQQILDLLATEAGRVLGDLLYDVEAEAEPFQLGQYGDVDIALTQDWLSLQMQSVALSARDRSLDLSEHLLVQQLDRLPELINEYDRLQPEVDITRETLEQLLAAKQELAVALAQGGFNWQVIEAPEPGRQTGPNIKKSIIMNILGGLFLGGAAAFARDAIDNSLHTPEEIAAYVRLSTIGTLPKGAKLNTEVVLDWTPFVDAIDLTYKKLQLLSESHPWKTLLITSALEEEGKSTVAIAIALSGKRFYERVLLIDANLRHPQLHHYLNVPNEKGLSTVLTDDPSLQSSLPIVKTELGIDVLTAGPIIDDPLTLINSKSLGQLLAGLAYTYDRIILDSPPLIGKVDSLQLASLCDEMCLISRVNTLTESAVDDIQPMLEHKKPIGIIVNCTKYAHELEILNVTRKSYEYLTNLAQKPYKFVLRVFKLKGLKSIRKD
ncbi:MAG: polysaccharide biosynthesis tyrosine autokinase [Leptolyngbyaceae bacterium]|nr:polysaccharide biosynthesis tyrosine autokinase [Leptolyngbyaceae bacterium]